MISEVAHPSLLGSIPSYRLNLQVIHACKPSVLLPCSLLTSMVAILDLLTAEQALRPGLSLPQLSQVASPGVSILLVQIKRSHSRCQSLIIHGLDVRNSGKHRNGNASSELSDIPCSRWASLLRLCQNTVAKKVTSVSVLRLQSSECSHERQHSARAGKTRRHISMASLLGSMELHIELPLSLSIPWKDLRLTRSGVVIMRRHP